MGGCSSLQPKLEAEHTAGTKIAPKSFLVSYYKPVMLSPERQKIIPAI
jgi:hypothetical protein